MHAIKAFTGTIYRSYFLYRLNAGKSLALTPAADKKITAEHTLCKGDLCWLCPRLRLRIYTDLIKNRRRFIIIRPGSRGIFGKYAEFIKIFFRALPSKFPELRVKKV